MIKLINSFDLPSVNFTDGFSVTKIKANFLSYKTDYPFLLTWNQLNEKGVVTALIQKLENAVFIVAKASADLPEIKDFIDVIGCSSVSATPEILSGLSYKFNEYQVLAFGGKSKGEPLPYPDIKKVYSLLFGEKNESIRPTDFEGFYVDLSHKIRRENAAALTLENAVCVASHITNDSAVISGVAVQNAARSRGLGNEILTKMLNALGNKTVYVAAEESVLPFYIKNGFKKSHKIAIYETEEIKLC